MANIRNAAALSLFLQAGANAHAPWRDDGQSNNDQDDASLFGF